MKEAIYLCLLLACVSCVTNPDNGFNKEGVPKEITRTFEEFGFSITAPCDLFCNKYPSHAFVVAEYYSIQKNLPFYRIEVREKLIIDELSETEQNEELDEMIRTCFIGFTKVEKVLFSNSKYPGYVGDKNLDGSTVRMMMFNKGKYIISLIVTADTSVIDQKFNEFTNSFKAID